MTERRARLPRQILSWVFLILFCLTAPLALLAGWARLSLLAAADYYAIVGGLAEDLMMQETVAHTIAGKVGEAVRGENPTATEALLAGAASATMADAARDVVSSAQFADVWREENRALYEFLIAGPDVPRGEPAVLDLSPLLPLMMQELDERQIPLPEGVTLKEEDLHITLLDAQAADPVRHYVRKLDLAAFAMLAAAIVSMVLSIGLAPERLAALERAGFGLAIAMVALIALLVIYRTWLASTAEFGGPVIGAILDVISQQLRLSAVGLALAGLVLGCVFAGLRALRYGTAPRRALPQ